MNKDTYLHRINEMKAAGYTPEYIRLYAPFLNPLYDMFGSFNPSLKECLEGMVEFGFWNKFDDESQTLTFKIEGKRCLLVQADYSVSDKCMFSFPNVVEWLEQAIVTSEVENNDMLGSVCYEILKDIEIQNELNSKGCDQ